jgi:hypothetical protein
MQEVGRAHAIAYGGFVDSEITAEEREILEMGEPRRALVFLGLYFKAEILAAAKDSAVAMLPNPIVRYLVGTFTPAEVRQLVDQCLEVEGFREAQQRRYAMRE